jgi:cytochrome c oxidase subunit 2
MCGTGHTGMRGTIIVESQEEFDAWIATKKPQYLVANPDKDTKAAPKDSTGVKPVAAILKK